MRPTERFQCGGRFIRWIPANSRIRVLGTGRDWDEDYERGIKSEEEANAGNPAFRGLRGPIWNR